METTKDAQSLEQVMLGTKFKVNNLNILLQKLKNPESYSAEGYCVKHKFKFTATYVKSPCRDKWLMLPHSGCLKCLAQKNAEEATLYVRKLNGMNPIEYILNHKRIDALEEAVKTNRKVVSNEKYKHNYGVIGLANSVLS